MCEADWSDYDLHDYNHIPILLCTTGTMNKEATCNADQHNEETKMSHEDQGEQRQRVRDRQLTVMTVAMTLAFFIFTAPTFIHLLLFRNYDPKSSTERQTSHAWSGTMVVISNTLNNAFNFFMYALTGSKFRSDFKNLICCQRKRIT